MEEPTDIPAVETELTLDEIIAQLDTEYTGELPEAALRAAQRRRDEIAPRLIELLRTSTELVRTEGDVISDGQIYALYLLAEFRCQEALPAVVGAISLPDDGPLILFGDVILEDLHRLLAIFTVDSLELVDGLVSNDSLNKYVRWEALQTFCSFIREGRMTRAEGLDRLRGHLREAIAKRDADLATYVVIELLSYSPQEAMEEIEEAFRLQLVDTVNWEEVKECCAAGEAAFQREMGFCEPPEIEDAVEELRAWAGYQEYMESEYEPGEVDWAPAEYDGVALHDEWGGGFDDASEKEAPVSTTIRYEGLRIGRNDPCPCGSGKKYKKCCARGGGLLTDDS